MCAHLDEMAPVEVAVAHFDGTDRLAEYRSHHGVPAQVRLVADPDRRLYRAFGIGRGTWWRVWGPGTIGAYLRLMRRGRRFHRPQNDARQLGGDLVVAPSGRVAAAWFPAAPDDRPPVDEVVAAVRATRGGD